MARVRPLSKAAAWWSRSSGVPSPSGAMAMTERVRPRTATWPELFFDLAFALVVAELAAGLRDDRTLHGVLVFAGLFSSVWWAWAGFTFYANRFDTDDVVYRRQVGSHACCRRAGRQRQRRDRVAGRTVRVFVMPPSGWCWSPSICVPMTVAWTAFMARSERRMLTAYPALPPSTWAYAHHPGSSFALQRHPWLPDPICLTHLAFSRLLSTIQFHQGQPCDDAAARWTAMQDPQWRSILCSGRVRAQQPVVEQGGPDVPDPRALLPTG
jgi:hypothetical protein